MLARFLAAFFLLLCAARAGQTSERMFVGTWRDDVSDPSMRVTFRTNHSFIIQGSDRLATFIEGRWRIQDGSMFISNVKAAGKPLGHRECGQAILSVSNDTFVLEAFDPKDTPVTYTRVR